MQRSNIFERYRTLEEYRKQCLKNVDSAFIDNHESSIIININRTKEEATAVIVLTDRDGADDAYLFVRKNADFQIGDYFTWKETTYFAYEQINIAKEVDYIKYKILECNVFVNNSFWAYFKSSLASVKDVSVSNNAEVSKIIPLLIAPKNDMLKIGGTIEFNNQTWDIEDGDIFTINGVGYYYLSRGMNSRDEEEWEPEEDFPSNLYYVGAEISLPTEMGYYKALKKVIAEDGTQSTVDYKVKLCKRNMDLITILPLESGELIIQTLKQNNIIETTFLIKENV